VAETSGFAELTKLPQVPAENALALRYKKRRIALSPQGGAV